MPKKFENGGFTLKTHQTFSAHITTEKFENAKTNLRNLRSLCLRKTREGKLHDYHGFRKDLISKYFPSKLKRHEGVLKFLRFVERFGKAPFS